MTATILIVEDDKDFRETLSHYLTLKDYQVIGVDTLAGARQAINRGEGDIILLDVQLPDGFGPNLLYEVANMPLRPPIIIVTGRREIEIAVDAMKNGALDFIIKPIKFEQLEQSIHKASEIVRMRRELAHIRLAEHQKLDFIVGDNPVVKKVLALAQRAAAASASVLITGETGTGKDILAKFIHKFGARSDKFFVDISMAAFPSGLVETELFGNEAYAFTTAEKRKIGLMEVADDGILFLDEISSMPLDVQAKLLRAIEEQAFRRVGGAHLIHVNVQILAASNRDLNRMIEENTFRSDLYYRLKVIDLYLPPLRERIADVPELVGFFIRKKNPKLGMNVVDITSRALDALMNYYWPGNIRQLDHAIEHAMLICDGEVIDTEHLPSDITSSG